MFSGNTSRGRGEWGPGGGGAQAGEFLAPGALLASPRGFSVPYEASRTTFSDYRRDVKSFHREDSLEHASCCSSFEGFLISCVRAAITRQEVVGYEEDGYRITLTAEHHEVRQ